MPMGKGFAIDSNQELGHLLLAGYEKHSSSLQSGTFDPLADPRLESQSRLPSLKIAAITNDAVATLASLSYLVRSESVGRVAIGVILATGSNAAAPIKLTQLHESKHPENCFGPIKTSRDDVIVNTEWTLPGTTAPLKSWMTEWDEIISNSAERPHFQPFEYMTSGRYLGELVRLIVLSLVITEGIQKDHLPEHLCKRHALTTKYIGELELLEDKAMTERLLKDFPPPNPSLWSWNSGNAALMRSIIFAVVKRSAALFAAATVGLLAYTGQLDLQELNSEKQDTASHLPQDASDVPATLLNDHLVVAYAGAVIAKYPGYRQMCQRFIDDLSLSAINSPQEKKRVILREAPDGGIIGAGVVAGIATTSG
jgi:hexokinase